ncbi:alpha/beta hydrolase family protein [Trinickia sp.]|uniref:alpha/beta hydrolase family protein n=1 Tax=Trinickia sp. TaxID=2571163 RepID=UPI003F80993D
MKCLATVAVLLSLIAGPAFAFDVGFQEVKIPNGAEPALVAGVWYPTNEPAAPHALGDVTQTVAPDAPVAGNHLPLIVMSHGGAGWYGSHYETALALARAGFVAAAVSHAGDTFDDQSRVLQLWRRPAQLRRLVDYMVDGWRGREQLDAARIGAFGFSNGGFTVLVAAGGIPDLLKVEPFCEAHSDQDLCRALQQAHVDVHAVGEVPPSAWVHDPRIKAIVIAAPAFGFAFGKAGLGDVRAPVQLWSAADDRHQPHPNYDEPVRDDLPHAPEYRLVANAGHYDFLPPCDTRLSQVRPEICKSLPGFDRAAFHERFNAGVVRFFRAALR